MSTLWNFNPGPAMLPPSVRRRVGEELEDWNGTGVSVMEVSHRSAPFQEMAARCEQNLRDLLRVPGSHRILFLQGGATAQFALAPLNFCGQDQSACYAVLGHWGAKARRVAATVCRTSILGGVHTDDGRPKSAASWQVPQDAAFLHYVVNETVDGLVMDQIPDPGTVPLLCDASSWLLSEAVDIGRFGMIYASAQKNIGPAGLTVVIVAREMLDRRPRRQLPPTMDYRVLADTGSMENTPPTFSWYVAGLVLEWLKRRGGITEIARVNRAKAQSLYDLIDSSELYVNPILPANRSRMNVVFRLREPRLEDEFVNLAARRGLIGLRGHSAVGGLRASIYNAMPPEGVNALTSFMREFEQSH